MATTRAAIFSILLLPLPVTSYSSSSSYRTTITFPSTASLHAAAMWDPLALTTHPFRRHVVLAQLPTAMTERVDKKPKWSARAVKSFALGQVESHKLKFTKVGTEALLMGILIEGTSEAAKFLRANGMTIINLREQTLELLGKADMYNFTDLSPSLTQPAQRALDWAVDEKLKSGEDVEVTTTHLLLGVWAQKDAAGHKLLDSFGFDDDKASLLAKSADRDVVMSSR